MKNQKHIALLVVMAMVFLIFGGCSTKLKTSNDALAYARIHYGAATLLREQKEGDKKVIFTLQDNDYGFQYTVTSSIADINIDGSSFGKYESTYDDYMSCYRDFILDDSFEQFDFVKKKYQIETETPDISLHSLMHIYWKSSEISATKDAAGQMADIFRNYEKKKLFSIYDIAVFDTNDNIIGKCKISTGQWQDQEALYDERVINWAKNKYHNVKYLNKVQKTFQDTGLSPDDVSKFYYSSDINCPQNPDDPVTYYYFEVNHQEFFVCDFWTTKSSEWYTNYDEIFRY